MIDNDRVKNKLSHGEQQFVLQALAEDFSCGHVVDLLKENFDKVVTRSNVYQYEKRYAVEIEELRKKIKVSIETIPISSKAVRLRRKEYIYQQYIQKKEYALALNILNDVERLDSPAPVTDKPGINIAVNNTTQNTTILNQLSDQELDGLSRAIIQRRQAVNN